MRIIVKGDKGIMKNEIEEMKRVIGKEKKNERTIAEETDYISQRNTYVFMILFI